MAAAPGEKSASNAVIMDLEKKNVILAKKLVLEAERVRKLDTKIDEVKVPTREFNILLLTSCEKQTHLILNAGPNSGRAW